jgi:hypothetical protein
VRLVVAGIRGGTILMAEPKRKSSENQESNIELEGFEQIFDAPTQGHAAGGHISDPFVQAQMEKLLDRFTELVSLTVDQRVETAKIATQLIENQRQLIATQQILIRLMERSIEITRHISSIEEKLPALFELPRVVESLRQRVAQIEGVETY